MPLDTPHTEREGSQSDMTNSDMRNSNTSGIRDSTNSAFSKNNMALQRNSMQSSEMGSMAFGTFNNVSPRESSNFNDVQ